ncbi:LOW QUALITY PROTEIN: hypothetical protein OSB04_032212 [Centaurea solstitialis]|uniref:TIR domain-containing protein n=1 Tax=Centaurea solstitialis TaxID=347529 RepID=A0AA38W6U0_9ASTR|nr:LOW QUALITY PROTEIN: hypothetical protein OSB04_032212 [Centaurea solstitialis]
MTAALQAAVRRLLWRLFGKLIVVIDCLLLYLLARWKRILLGKGSRILPAKRKHKDQESYLSQDHLVFLSFRGEDTRMNFTSYLYNALMQEGIRTYKDDKALEIGKSIAPELLNAIERSRFAIMVLSSNFATSKWCLEEIAKVVACEEQGKLTVIPVFYHVSPSDVRHQRNCFAQGFANHEEDPEVTTQKVEIWRAAFARVGEIKGIHVTPHREEPEVIREIITFLKVVQDEPPTDTTAGLVGIESQVNEVKKILSMESSDVHFIGIWGMSGIGKTTLARVVYDSIQKGNQRDEFHRFCFIENIKDISKENDTKLYKVQQKLLVKILRDESIHVGGVFEGKNMLEKKLRGMKVFIVLDDVNHLDQLTYLAGGREWFGAGSRIVVTTTNVDLLHRHKIINEVYQCEGLKGDEALRLFWQSAFKGDPMDGYEKLSTDIVKLADGLPLALNVYGSILYGKNESYWKEMLKRLGDYPHEDVLKKLETIYNKLDREQQNTFIYIACFLRGRNEVLVKDILTNIGLYSECGITDLQNRSLITINHDDSVWMHDLLQLMCWEVLHKESERYNRFIAIKKWEDVEDILSSKPEYCLILLNIYVIWIILIVSDVLLVYRMRTIEIINQEPNKVDEGDYFTSDDPACFSKMKRLKFLRISNIHFRKGLDYLSNDLRILEWDGCSLKSLPLTFAPRHIYEFQMRSSQLETLWEKDLDLPNLRSINLSFSKDLMKIPDLTSTTNLVKLNLEGCTNLTQLHESILSQKKLRYMNLKGCTGLKNLGRSTMEMDALEALLLSGCSNLQHIPKFGKNMQRLDHLQLGEVSALTKLDASGTLIDELPSSINGLKRLRLLRVNRCRLLPKTGSFLYSNLQGTMSSGLREIDLSYCNLSVVPDGIGLLYGLTNLDLSGNDFVSLPASLVLLSNLRMLCLNNCKSLRTLPKLSLVDVDTLHGLQLLKTRFNYYISGEGVEVSKVHGTSNNSSPTISCLNCPKLAENENGSHLAERVLNSYLQLRTNNWKTPEAIFEIVGGGREIPSGFKQLGSDDFIFVGPWIGLAICAVVSVHNIDACMEAKYVVTAHIHVWETHNLKEKWEVSIPIYFSVAGLENQLVFYWTKTDDLQRIIESTKKNVNVSFSFAPEDGNLQVTKFGIRLIRDEDILQLKQYEYSTTLDLNNLFRAAFYGPIYLKHCLHACEADTDLHSSVNSMKTFILEYGEQKHSLEGIHNIIKSLLEINQEVTSECREEWRNAQLLPFFNDYYRISHGTSGLYNDFVRFLKDTSDSWLSVKLALEQVLIKSRGDDYTCKEMLQQLDDLEAAKSIRFSDNFLTTFARICKHVLTFTRYLDGVIETEKMFKSMKALAKVSCIIIAGIVSILVTYKGGGRSDSSESLFSTKDIRSNSMWLHMMEKLSVMSPDGRLPLKIHISNSQRSFDRELQIWDFDDNAILLQELKKKMTGSGVYKEKEVEMMIVIDKLGKKIDNISKTIEDMISDAHKYSHDITEVGKTFNQFIADDSELWVTKFCFIPLEDILQMKLSEDPMTKAILQRTREGYCTYGEMLQQLNDLEATGTVGFSHNFITSFEYFCEKTADFLRCMGLVIYGNKQFTPAISEHVTLGIYSNKMSTVLKGLGREYSLKIRSILSIVATCMGDFKLLEEMENRVSNLTFFYPIQCFLEKSGRWFDERGLVQKTSYSEELRIWDCYGNEILLQELKQKMAGFSRLTEENDGEMMTAIHELKRKLDCLSKTLTDQWLDLLLVFGRSLMTSGWTCSPTPSLAFTIEPWFSKSWRLTPRGGPKPLMRLN